jgi:hypothetical protein
MIQLLMPPAQRAGHPLAIWSTGLWIWPLVGQYLMPVSHNLLLMTHLPADFLSTWPTFVLSNSTTCLLTLPALHYADPPLLLNFSNASSHLFFSGPCYTCFSSFCLPSCSSLSELHSAAKQSFFSQKTTSCGLGVWSSYMVSHASQNDSSLPTSADDAPCHLPLLSICQPSVPQLTASQT